MDSNEDRSRSTADVPPEIANLMEPRAETVDELTRLYELNFYVRQHPLHDSETSEQEEPELPREIGLVSALHENGRYTTGAVEFGLPVLAAPERSYNTAIMGKHAAVLNAHIQEFYRERAAGARNNPS